MADLPDLTSPDTPPEVADLFARSAFAWTTDALGYGRPVLVDAEPISEAAAHADLAGDDDTPASHPDRETHPAPTMARASRWTFPAGPTLTEIRALTQDLAANFGCEVLIDHRADVMYYGALTTGTTVFRQGEAAGQTMIDLAREDKWTHIWSQVLKQSSNPPTIQHPTLRAVPLASGRPVTLTQVGFVTRMGIDPAEYRGLESKLATALNASPFVSVVGWPAAEQPKGTRHPQAFGVAWSDGPVPTSPAELPDGEASQWVLAGRLNAAFDAARLVRPELAGARVLTARTSRGHIWEATVRLYGGVTLADVRGAAPRIQRELAVPWLRIAPAESGCTIFAGANPDSVTLLRPSRDEIRLLTLDWNQAFADAKVTGNNGLLPDLVAKGALPRNPQVQVLDFSMPPGMDVAGVKAGLAKVRVATGNDFVEVCAGPTGASTLRLLVARTNPLPGRVDFDFQAADAADGILFATGIEGEPLEFRAAESAHVLLAGATGTGKSQLAQAFLYGAVIKGTEIYVVDPVKGGADFQFAKPYAKAFAQTPFEAAAVMRAVHAEVVRRKDSNAAAGVGSYRELPVPPPAIYLLIDEFTSLMGLDTPPKPSDDPEIEAERERILAENNARQTVGTIAGKIAREARSTGVTLLLGTQKLTARLLETIPSAGEVKTNLARVLLGKASFGDRASALRASTTRRC